MVQGTRHTRACVLLVCTLLSLAAGVVIAQQQSPVAAMFGDDEKRGKALALSFLRVELPPATAAGMPLQIYLTAGDLERAFDRPEFRPDGAIVPTNTDLSITAASPATQRVLIDRVQKHPEIMRDLQDQITERRKQTTAASGKEAGLLRIGMDTFVAQLPRRADKRQSEAPFPKVVCLIATDFAQGGAIDRRELFTQDRVRKGIAGCLAALDASGVRSLAVPLMGAASSGTQAKDAMYEGQRLLKECRLLNSLAGIALGIHDFAPGRRNIREIGIVQWDQEIDGMFSVPAGSRFAESAQAAYRLFAEQIKVASRKGLNGEKTTASDVDGYCNAIFSAQ
jgi:hypothetical protein